MKKHLILLVGIMLFTAGCITTPFANFYYDQTGGADIASDAKVLPSHSRLRIFQGTDTRQDARAMSQKGYVLIGYSFFKADEIDINQAREHARQVNAAVVLLYSETAESVAGLQPFSSSPAETVESIQAKDPAACTAGTVPVRTYSGRTTYVPRGVSASDCLATYWAKLKPLTLGVHVKSVPAEVEKMLPGKGGVLVELVVIDSPAHQAGIREGDVLTKIGRTDIPGMDRFSRNVAEYAGQETTVVVYRNGRRLEKTIRLNP